MKVPNNVSFNKVMLSVVVAAMICFFSCSTTNNSPTGMAKESAVGHDRYRIAVFPVYNLSASPVPLAELREALIASLKENGLDLLDEDVLYGFMSKHTVRYTGGINTAIAKALKDECEADAVLITSLELYHDTNPPKIALISRLVSMGDDPSILWVDGTGLSGDDSPGLLDLTLIEQPERLLNNAVNHISRSLNAYLKTKEEKTASKGGRRKFWPKASFLSPVLSKDRKYKVAILPFYNRSERKYAGEIVSLHFVRQLNSIVNFSAIEPGMVRQALLEMRIIMVDGMSLADSDALFYKLNADLILTGRVFNYEDYKGSAGEPKVDFSAFVVERKSRERIWTSMSYNKGNDGVFFFDLGKARTANSMASEMVWSAVQTLNPR